MIPSLAVIETHPIQYHAPVYRHLHERLGLPVTVIHGTDCSVVGYRDAEFRADISWGRDLLRGYEAWFLARVADGGATRPEGASTAGLWSALGRAAPAAVLLVGYRPRFHLQAMAVARARRIPLLLRAETTDHAVARGALASTARDALLRRLYRRFERLLPIGQRSRGHYLRLGVPPERLIDSPYCVDEGMFQADEAARAALRGPARDELGLKEDQLVVVYSGKLSDRKGVDLLVDAAALLPPELRPVVLFVGDGELRQTLARAAQRRGVRAHFVGVQPQRSLSRWYHAADVLALPSRRGETWGLVVNEALLHGLPCAVTEEVGCAPDLIEEGVTGSLCRPGDAAALARALRAALALSGHGPRGREVCRARAARCSVARAAEGIERAFREVVE